MIFVQSDVEVLNLYFKSIYIHTYICVCVWDRYMGSLTIPYKNIMDLFYFYDYFILYLNNDIQ